MNTNQNVETAKTHEPSSLMWSHQWKVQGGGREGWSRGWVSGSRGEKRDGKHSSGLCMYAYRHDCLILVELLRRPFVQGVPKKFLNLSEKSHAAHFDFCQTFNSSSFEILQIFCFPITLLSSSPFSVICRSNSETVLRAKTWFCFPRGGLGGCKDGGDRDYSDRHDCSHLAFKRQLKPASNIWLSGFCPDLVDDQRILSTLSRPRPWTSVKAVLITMACDITKTRKRLQMQKNLKLFNRCGAREWKWNDWERNSWKCLNHRERYLWTRSEKYWKDCERNSWKWLNQWRRSREWGSALELGAKQQNQTMPPPPWGSNGHGYI